MRWPFKILGLLIVAAFVAPLVKSCSEPSVKSEVTATSYYDEQFEARAAAERAVKYQLKSPSTVKFIDQFSVKNKKGEWEITGALDALNSYGVPIRSRYICAFRREGDAMRLIRITFPL
jgi:hypothetical protein